MRINPFVYGVIVVALFMGVIYGFQGAGVWSTSGKVTGSGERIAPSASDVNSIKGWMTLDQVSAAFRIPVEEILSAFNLPSDTPPSTALKDLESDTFDVTALRTWITEYKSSHP